MAALGGIRTLTLTITIWMLLVQYQTFYIFEDWGKQLVWKQMKALFLLSWLTTNYKIVR
jgi:hypothetical protein